MTSSTKADAFCQLSLTNLIIFFKWNLTSEVPPYNMTKVIPGRESDNDRHDDSDSGNSGTNWNRIKETVETQQS